MRGEKYDIGTPEGFLQAQLALAAAGNFKQMIYRLSRNHIEHVENSPRP